MNKKGQFFLIAALVIVALLLSVGTVYNYARVQKADTKIYDLSKELNYESLRVIDSGVYQNMSQADITNYVKTLAANYSSSTIDTDLFVVYGNSTSAVLFNNTCESHGSAHVLTAGSVSACTREIPPGKPITPSSSGNVTIELGDSEYHLHLEEGQNFYLVLKKNEGGEQFVATSENAKKD